MGSWIDATIWIDEGFEEAEFRTRVGPCFERYAYGKETAPSTGRKHLQFRGILKCGVGSKEEQGYLAFLSANGFRHITRTSVRNFDYIYKDGDFYLSWEKVREEYTSAVLLPWQQKAKEMAYDTRTVEVYIDVKGNSGKTFFGKCMESQHIATYIPPLGRGSDILSAVLEKPKSKWYIIDFPRSFEPNRETWATIEMVKNGLVYDHRYKYKEMDLGYNPRVSVFTNSMPKRLAEMLSMDRLRIYEITGAPDVPREQLFLNRIQPESICDWGGE